MKTYIRKMHNNRFCLISGIPENHSCNSIVEQFYTRRQAIRYAGRNGYELVIRGRNGTADAVPKRAG